MKMRNIIGLILILASLACLYPGLYQPILTINVGAQLPLVGSVTLHNSTQSIMKTIETLFKNNNSLVASLILLFSVLVPLIKAIILLVILLFKKMKGRKMAYNFVSLIGKWSMADVFVVGVFLAFLATRSDDNIHAQLETGFYYFLAYCILSLLAIQFISIDEEATA